MISDRYDIDEEIYLTDVLTQDDILSFIKYLNNPVIHNNTLTIPYPYTVKDGEEFVEKVNMSSADKERIFTIRLIANNELIGACGLIRSPTNNRTAEIGYWLGEPYWNRGVMPKVVKKVTEIIKHQWQDLVRIEAQIFPWNKASMRVVEKCGFVFERILLNNHRKNGQDVDAHSYALIME